MTRVSDAGTRRASSSARFGISGLDPLAAKLAAERLAASRREALELRTRLERAERRNADLERSRGEGARRDPAGAERWLVGTTERETNGDDDDDDGDDEAGLLKNESASFAGPARDDETEAATDADRAHRARRSPARLERLELARARREIENLREENDELRRFARSVAGVDPSAGNEPEAPADVDVDVDDASVSRLFLGDGAEATAHEARRLEAVVAATERMAGLDASDASENASGDASTDETRTNATDDAFSSPRRETPFGETASLRLELAALRAELRAQANARAILEAERDAFAARAAEQDAAVRASAAREAASAASLRAAREDALAAAAFGEELARSCAEKLERAESIARAWEREARRLGRAERDNAERRVLAAAEKAEVAAVESRTLEMSSARTPSRAFPTTTDGIAWEKSDARASAASASGASGGRGASAAFPSPSGASPRASLNDSREDARRDRTPDASFTPGRDGSRDSPFAASGVFADATAGRDVLPPSRSPPSVSDRSRREAAPLTPGEALRASLRRQSETLDALRGARERRDEELHRVRDRLDRLVASSPRVARGAAVSETGVSIAGEETASSAREPRDRRAHPSSSGLAMPSMPSFGAPPAAMHEAAGTIQRAWRRKKKKPSASLW